MRNARQRKRHRFAADHQHPLVAQDDLGQVTLHHDGLRAIFVEGFNDAAQVQTIGTHAENAHAAHAVKWLQDDVVMLGMKGPHVGFVACHQGRPGELRKFEDG